MRQIHKREKEQFQKLFQQEHIENIKDRVKILEVFLQTEQHITVTGLRELLKKNGYQFDAEFVDDTLKLMCRFGFAQKNRFDNGQIRYEHFHLGQHHDHMICTKCHSIFEFEDDSLEALQAKIAERYGFHMLQHKMEIYGICPDCLKDRVRLMPLIMAKPGERLTIREFSGGSSAHMRLLTIGLRVGDRIEVITNSGSGQLVVAVDYNRFVLGRGMSKKIIVEPDTN